MEGTEIKSNATFSRSEKRDGTYPERKFIVQTKDMRFGCYSLDPEVRKNSIGGAMYQAPAIYKYGVDPNWNGGRGFYYKGTHIIPIQYMEDYKKYFE